MRGFGVDYHWVHLEYAFEDRDGDRSVGRWDAGGQRIERGVFRETQPGPGDADFGLVRSTTAEKQEQGEIFFHKVMGLGRPGRKVSVDRCKRPTFAFPCCHWRSRSTPGN